ncbi:UDP-N-acetylmuramoyl-tripeptide--D-alanyl-D-alanine ligase [Clostridium homopropionicum DSM 5847]|uniref:UDP-N-acetylmuramoyl-tripeptide--D-alanyl-D-alanine ligase n=1 Tax=Clostridium homopropionicum DSM 5847 TaxID=1121318 RepID=A0A0L6ZDD5_9CLOT|nr:UDP-N-acetylmuramoyl-tripeptide--D-alanyl-D-alanine ligase [Clostridium homopropionicum]KOA20980.1 UDP-N-acetylmuramoyl-tripeptide--D-alanyl-D-alanine ligase [Clostridium homopropionicum DSM 5847]SFG00423.1 UDP-N-acetylmuramoyl-tripeptide--D-alanyl-D-alanine ligase [Clostridium homopropionicum]
METLSFSEIVEAVEGKVIINGNCHKYNILSTDTRKICKDSIFVALRGQNFNGNNYVVEASSKGANLCIVDEINFDSSEVLNNTSIILVKDSKKALLDLAEYYRSKLKVKVVAITGSTGKTSTKDLTAAALSGKFKVFKTKGNLNNEIGLPLMVFELDNSYDVAVLEMGMSNFGEIEKLAKVARPDLALITNIGVSHIENLKTKENILKAKMEITKYFSKDNILIINNENDLLSTLDEKDYKIFRVGFGSNVDLKAKDIVIEEDMIEFSIEDKGLNNRFSIPIPGKHNVLNSLLAIAAGKLLGVEYSLMKESIKSINFTSMRLDIVKGEKYTIIDDSYNASPDSMKAALDVLKNISGNRKIAVLGTMRELGDESFKFHKEVGNYARKKDTDLLITVGEYTSAYREGFAEDSKFISFQNLKEATEYLLNNLKVSDVVLVKASRSMRFETIVKELKAKNC